MPGTNTTPRPITVGDKVTLKPVQESSYLPQSLVDYLEDKGIDSADATFTVSSVFSGRRDTMVDFQELDTRGGYYLRRFEIAPDAADNSLTFTVNLGDLGNFKVAISRA